jgi:hypothetical protein
MGTSKTILLTRADAACLDAIRAGAGRQNLIALQTKLTLNDAAASIAKLAAAGLVIRQQRYCGEATRRGKGALVTIVADPERSRGGKRFGKIRPGTSSDRLIALLDHPRRGTELAKKLGISSQRVHQLMEAVLSVRKGSRSTATWRQLDDSTQVHQRSDAVPQAERLSQEI